MIILEYGKTKFYIPENLRKKPLPDALQNEFKYKENWLKSFKIALNHTIKMRNIVQKARSELMSLEREQQEYISLKQDDIQILKSLKPDMHRLITEYKKMQTEAKKLLPENIIKIIQNLKLVFIETEKIIIELISCKDAELNTEGYISKMTEEIIEKHERIAILHDELVSVFQNNFTDMVKN